MDEPTMGVPRNPQGWKNRVYGFLVIALFISGIIFTFAVTPKEPLVVTGLWVALIVMLLAAVRHWSAQESAASQETLFPSDLDHKDTPAGLQSPVSTPIVGKSLSMMSMSDLEAGEKGEKGGKGVNHERPLSLASPAMGHQASPSAPDIILRGDSSQPPSLPHVMVFPLALMSGGRDLEEVLYEASLKSAENERKKELGHNIQLPQSTMDAFLFGNSGFPLPQSAAKRILYRGPSASPQTPSLGGSHLFSNSHYNARSARTSQPSLASWGRHDPHNSEGGHLYNPGAPHMNARSPSVASRAADQMSVLPWTSSVAGSAYGSGQGSPSASATYASSARPPSSGSRVAGVSAQPGVCAEKKKMEQLWGLLSRRNVGGGSGRRGRSRGRRKGKHSHSKSLGSSLPQTPTSSNASGFPNPKLTGPVGDRVASVGSFGRYGGVRVPKQPSHHLTAEALFPPTRSSSSNLLMPDFYSQMHQQLSGQQSPVSVDMGLGLGEYSWEPETPQNHHAHNDSQLQPDNHSGAGGAWGWGDDDTGSVAGSVTSIKSAHSQSVFPVKFLDQQPPLPPPACTPIRCSPVVSVRGRGRSRGPTRSRSRGRSLARVASASVAAPRTTPRTSRGTRRRSRSTGRRSGSPGWALSGGSGSRGQLGPAPPLATKTTGNRPSIRTPTVITTSRWKPSCMKLIFGTAPLWNQWRVGAPSERLGPTPLLLHGVEGKLETIQETINTAFLTLRYSRARAIVGILTIIICPPLWIWVFFGGLTSRFRRHHTRTLQDAMNSLNSDVLSGTGLRARLVLASKDVPHLLCMLPGRAWLEVYVVPVDDGEARKLPMLCFSTVRHPVLKKPVPA